jgi:hypothetical protein
VWDTLLGGGPVDIFGEGGGSCGDGSRNGEGGNVVECLNQLCQ